MQGDPDSPPKILTSPNKDVKPIPTNFGSSGQCVNESGMPHESILWTGGRMTPHLLSYNKVGSYAARAVGVSSNTFDSKHTHTANLRLIGHFHFELGFENHKLSEHSLRG